jgi:hypothetical protein
MAISTNNSKLSIFTTEAQRTQRAVGELPYGETFRQFTCGTLRERTSSTSLLLPSLCTLRPLW